MKYEIRRDRLNVMQDLVGMSARQTFIHSDEGKKWLRDVHLSDIGTFGCAIIYGNEDWPNAIEVFDSDCPEWNEQGAFYTPVKEESDESV